MEGQELTDQEKKRLIAGQCNFLVMSLLSTIAVFNGMYCMGYCDFARRHIETTDDFDLQQTCTDLGYNSTSVNMQMCQTFFANHGVSFYAWYATVPVDVQVCMPYTWFNPNVGWIVPTFDSNFNAAKVFAVLANIFGSFGWFSLMFASCCPISQERVKGLSCYFLLAVICQSFTFLIFASNVCSKGFFAQYYPDKQGILDDNITNVYCTFATGASQSLSSAIMYFLCFLLAPTALAPAPVGYSRAATHDGLSGVPAGAQAPAGTANAEGQA